jgi:hypothetical protein
MKSKTSLRAPLIPPLAAVCLVQPALSATIYFAADGGQGTGSTEVALPMEKLGSVPVPRGRLLIRGNVAELSYIPEWQFDRHPALAGPVLDTQLSTSSRGNIISGLIFFNSGEWLHYYDNPAALETVESGAQSVSGHIESVQNGAITIQTLGGRAQTLPLTEVTAIRSPRAFRFSIPATALQKSADGNLLSGDARLAMLSATGTPFRVAALRRQVQAEMNDGDISTGKLVAAGTLLSFAELAQLVPYLVVPLYSSKIQHQMMNRQFYSLTQGENSPKANFTNLLPP